MEIKNILDRIIVPEPIAKAIVTLYDFWEVVIKDSDEDDVH